MHEEAKHVYLHFHLEWKSDIGGIQCSKSGRLLKMKMELLNRTDMGKKVKWYGTTRELKRTVGVSEARSPGARM